MAGGLALFYPETLNRLSHADEEMKICDVLQLGKNETITADVVSQHKEKSNLSRLLDLLHF